ncbi:hypothetical protein D3D02_16980 [Halobellus sp. Atlit-38R]|uniref:hypothetical protein n=1 Tax=Halobellus sp. Atlit-38R TaxID=2282131 RepID=UPI000EF2558C|nr:hypothetical protein [Halobellus sp. Atlit-38R]RLM83696.1 hypothetical protein D3D02_16980 [Halobellus sp. Atlit-38R]
MQKLKNWIDLVKQRRIDNEYDLMLPIVADEGDGKSTLILQLIGLWHDKIERGTDPESIFERIAWGERDEFKRLAVESQRKDVIAAPDAARILYKKDAMDPDQRELEKDLLDIRTHEFLFLLGFQWWNDIPTMLQERRAKQLLRIPRRGVVEGYNRNSLDEKLSMDDKKWPEPDMRDSFPSLEGTKVWEEYQKLDRKKKRERIAPDDDEDEEPEVDVRSIVDEIMAEGLEPVVAIHGGNKNPYIAKELIELNYGLSARNAKKAKLLLEQQSGDLSQYVEEA